MSNRLKYDEISSFLEKNCVVRSTAQQVLRNLRENYQKLGKVTDHDLLALSSVFGETLEKALEIVEGNKVTYFHTHSDTIGVYQVEGNSSNIYTVFPSVNYCPCPFYTYQVSGASQITCKHVLATIIANVINKKQSIEVTNEHLNDLLLTSVSLKYGMNDREDWNSTNSYVGQFMPPSPLPGMQTTFKTGPLPGIPPAVNFTSNDWAQVPPQTMPWGVPAESQPSLVRFTAGDFNPHSVPIKRKWESSADVPPAKMLVTEEKMAAHMRGLHISEEIKTPADVTTNMPCKEETMEGDSLPRLVISDEIKNLKTESIIPESILKKLEKPDMALVLWQPPATDLGSKLKELKRLSIIGREKEKENEMKDDGDMDVAIETETQNSSMDSVFRPIDPVPPAVQNQFFQPVPQFHGYSTFSHFFENDAHVNYLNRQ